MRRKRSHSQSSGTSVIHVHRIPSTQLDVGLLERELLSRDRKAESAKELKRRANLRRASARSSDAFIRQHTRPQNPRSRSQSQGETSRRQTRSCVKAKLRNREPANNSRNRARSTDKTKSDPERSAAPASSQSTADDANENAPRGRRSRECRCRRGPGRPRKRRSRDNSVIGLEHSVVELPVNSVLKIMSELSAPRNRRRRYSRSRHRSTCSSSTQSPYNKRRHQSFCTSCTRLPSRQRKRRKRAGTCVSFNARTMKNPGNLVSRYRVTPCPTNGACSSRSRRSYTSCSSSNPYYSSRKSRSTAGPGNRSYSNSSRSQRRLRRSRISSPSEGRRTRSSCGGNSDSCCSGQCDRSPLQSPYPGRHRNQNHRKRKGSRDSRRQSPGTSYTSKAAATAKGLLSRVSHVWSQSRDNVGQRSQSRHRDGMGQKGDTAKSQSRNKDATGQRGDKARSRSYSRDRRTGTQNGAASEVLVKEHRDTGSQRHRRSWSGSSSPHRRHRRHKSKHSKEEKRSGGLMCRLM